MPDSNDEDGARRLYLLAELARNSDDLDEQKSIVVEMESRFPKASAGRGALLHWQYLPVAARLCNSSWVLWRSGYTLPSQQARGHGALAGKLAHLPAGAIPDAARLFDEQIRLYPGAAETVSALTGADACMRRRTTNRPRPQPITAH